MTDTPNTCRRHGIMLTRRYSTSTWQPVGDPFCTACVDENRRLQREANTR